MKSDDVYQELTEIFSSGFIGKYRNLITAVSTASILFVSMLLALFGYLEQSIYLLAVGFAIVSVGLTYHVKHGLEKDKKMLEMIVSTQANVEALMDRTEILAVEEALDKESE